MGLASSQSRLLLLTARKSDLEYRSQMISQRKIMLAMETESLASDYTRVLANRRMSLVSTNATTGETETKDLTYKGLTTSATGKNDYIVTDSQGRLVLTKGADGNPQLPSDKFSLVTENGKPYAIYTGENGTQKFEVNPTNEVLNTDFFQNSLRNGGLYIQELNKDDDKFESKSWQGLNDIQDKLYTEDDPLATTNYETQSLAIQNQDKILDLELKQIETQHKAIETEYDSVKKVIDKNIEVSYKIFANG